MAHDLIAPMVQRPPTRIIASGTITITAGKSAAFGGSNSRQDRFQFVVTNLDAALSVKLQTLSGANFATVFPQRSVTIQSSADFIVANPNGSDVQVEVCELYPDIANLSQNQPRLAAVPAGGAAPSGGAAGGATGGSTGGTSGGGRGGTYAR
jgi:hypothetical protein